MIYWEITLRDHLLLPITPDSSGDTTYAGWEREPPTTHRLQFIVQKGMETVRRSWINSVRGLVFRSASKCLNFGFMAVHLHKFEILNMVVNFYC